MLKIVADGRPRIQATYVPRMQRAILLHRYYLRELPMPELAGVLAHELGHLEYGHPALLGGLRGLLTALLVGGWILMGPGAYLGACAAGFAAYVYIYRQCEFAADAWAARHCGAGLGLCAFLAFRRPRKQFSLHPSNATRIVRMPIGDRRWRSAEPKPTA